MEKALNIIVGIVIIAAFSYVIYLANQKNMRSKELDKKLSDNLDSQKEINKLIIEKIKSGELNLMGMTDKENGFVFAKASTANGHKKNKKVRLSKEKEN